MIDRRILLDLALDRRAHGGAVVDAEGRLLGLAAFAPRRQALVIPAATVERIAVRLEATGSIARGYLGAGLHPLAAAAGAIIVSLDEGGPARHAGLHVGDILTRWNGEPIRGVHDVFRRLGPDAVGESVTLDVMRADHQTQVTVAVAARPHK
jgi:S1-C subfamily serine protease